MTTNFQTRAKSLVLALAFLLVGCSTKQPSPPTLEVPNPEDVLAETAITQNAVLMQQDSDGDGYSDLAELLAGSDPSKKETFSRSNALEYVFKSENATLSLKGTPNIVNTYTGKYTSASIKNRGVLLSPIYELYNPSFATDIFEAELTLTYTGEPDADVAIYQYLDDGTLQLVENSIVSGNKVTARLQHFSKYTVAQRVIEDLSDYVERAFALCIDDSGSMFENVMSTQHGIANDPQALRWDFVASFYSKYPEDKIYCNHYTREVEELASFDMSNAEACKRVAKHAECVDAIINLPEDKLDNLYNLDQLVPDAKLSFTGTNTSAAAVKAMEALAAAKARNKYLIILTDGSDTVTYDHATYKRLMASSPGIIPIVIALGTAIDKESLQMYSGFNDGKIIYMNSADVFGQLDKIFSRIITGIDEEVSAYLSDLFGREIKVEALVDSGYRKEKDSLPFCNFQYKQVESGLSNGGVCFGIAYTEQEHYITGYVYPDKGTYSVNQVTALFSSYLDGTYPKIVPKYLTQSNYPEVLSRLQKLISVAKNPNAAADGLGEWVTSDNKKVFVPTDSKSSLAVQFFSGVTRQYKTNGGIFTDEEGYEYYYTEYCPIYEKCKKAIETKFKDYSLSDLDKACVEWLYILIYNYNLQMAGLTKRALGDSCYADTTTVGGFLQEHISDWLANWDGNGYFGDHPEYNTALLSIYNHLSAGIPAILSFQCAAGCHTVLCSRLFRDMNDPTAFYLEIDDSNSTSVQYIRICFGTMLDQCSKSIGERYAQEKLNLACPYLVECSGGYGSINRLVVSIDSNRLKKYVKNL